VTGSITDVGQFSGTLIPKSSFTVVPKISGRLKRLLIDIGDTVRRDQLVAVLEDEEYQQDVLQAEADLRVARANLEEAASTLEMARKDLERAKALQEKGMNLAAIIDYLKGEKTADQGYSRDVWVKYEIMPGIEISVRRDVEERESKKVFEIVRVAKSIAVLTTSL
jgi:multidrug efflux pump subunit AcrA (membrane-fusion protein)